MKVKQRTLVILVLVIGLVLSSCGPGQSLAPTVAPSETLKPVPTLTPVPTSTPAPTSTPVPTATNVPPTPASLGDAVSYEPLEISVLDVYRHDNLIPGNGYRYWANPGYMIIDLVVKVQNTGSTPASMKWGDAYVLDNTGSRSDVIFGGSRPATKKEKVNPLSVDYNDVGAGTLIEIVDTVYMRIIYIIPDKPEQKILFGIGDSPLIEFPVKK